MPPAPTQTLWVHYIGDLEPGVWCDHCLLPSAWRQRVAMTLMPLERPYDPDDANGEIVWCQNCDRILSTEKDT